METEDLNALSLREFTELMSRVCGSQKWVARMAEGRPYGGKSELTTRAISNWETLDEASWLEAFSHHPKIGDSESLRKRFASTANWAEKEQAGVGAADETVIDELRAYNEKYEERFGFIFIVCATGLSAQEMLARLKRRYKNSRQEELRNAVSENGKIILLRLAKT